MGDSKEGDRPTEEELMCGIVGVVHHQPVNLLIYDALTILQHRGQDAAGMATINGNEIRLRKDTGLVKDVFQAEQMADLPGNLGIGHVRYPTAGCDSPLEAQPLFRDTPYPMVLAHNGTLHNHTTLRNELAQTDSYILHTNSDSEAILNIFAQALAQHAPDKPTQAGIVEAVKTVHKRCQGAYAVVILLPGFGLVGFRDPWGIRPIVFGRGKDPGEQTYMIASESVALQVLGYELIDDIAPGEAIIVSQSGELTRHQCAENTAHAPCLFEFVYLARPDSIIDQVSVYKSRLRMGDNLAAKILREWPNHDIDAVIPIPDTSRSAAIQVAHHLGVKYREGFIKNRYIGRTFIMPGQALRKKSVRRKLNVIDLEFEGKNVLLVDDSIVRGTTCSQIAQMARDAGARRVYFASAAPPVRFPNVYGIDMPAASELIAHNRTIEQIAQAIGVDRLIYQDLDDLRQATQAGNPDLQDFEDSVFSGRYITGDIHSDYLDALEATRSDAAKPPSKSL